MKLIEKEKVAVVLTGDEDKRTLKKVIENAEWIELRFDCFIEKFPEANFRDWAKFIRSLTDAKIIGTARWHKERQNKNFVLPDRDRMKIYCSVTNFIDFFDVEIGSNIAKKICSIAQDNGKKMILSYHNFMNTPTQRKLVSICKKARRLNPEIIKIATIVKTTKDLFNLVSISLFESKHSDVVVIPMNTGVLERLVPLVFGSLFTYFAANQKTAPGQASLDLLIR